MHVHRWSASREYSVLLLCHSTGIWWWGWICVYHYCRLGKHVHKCLCHLGRVRRRVRFHFTRACCSWGGWIDKNGITSSFFFSFFFGHKARGMMDGLGKELHQSMFVGGEAASAPHPPPPPNCTLSLSLSFPGHIHCTKSSIPYVWIAFFYLLIMQLGYIVLWEKPNLQVWIWFAWSMQISISSSTF